MMKASSLRFSLAFDQVFPLVTPKFHILPIQLSQDNRRTKDELLSRKLKKKSISSLKFLNLTFSADLTDLSSLCICVLDVLIGFNFFIKGILCMLMYAYVC